MPLGTGGETTNTVNPGLYNVLMFSLTLSAPSAFPNYSTVTRTKVEI